MEKGKTFLRSVPTAFQQQASNNFRNLTCQRQKLLAQSNVHQLQSYLGLVFPTFKKCNIYMS